MWRSVKLITIFSMLTPVQVMPEESELLREASYLLSNNKTAEAVSLLESKMNEQAGNLQYDYLLGRAALEDNKANLAIFALERAVMVAPKEDVARFTLAKAYDAVGEVKQASNELSYIIKTSNKPNIKSMSQAYLSRIQNRHALNYQLILEAGLGNDSNVNSATHKSDFLGIDLSDNSQATSSTLSTAKIQTLLNYSPNKKLHFNAGADYYQFDYPDAEFVNTNGLALNTGISYKFTQSIQEKLQLQLNKTEVNKQFNNQQSVVQFTHQQMFTASNSISASLRAANISYAEAFSIKDTYNYSAGLQYLFKDRLQSKDSLYTSFSVISGMDDPIASESPYKRKYTGANTNVLLAHHHGKVNFLAAFSYINSSYDNDFFGKSREDNNSRVSLKLNIRVNPRWTIGPSLSYVRNHSSIDLYDYRRSQASLVVRHQVI